MPDQSDPPHQPPVTRHAPADKPTDETIKETFESIVMALILAFTFRAFVVEAFVIPTGSMAPTLLGRHNSDTSPQSGYRFTTDFPRRRGGDAVTPMIGSKMSMPGPRVSRSGDRILVQKYTYLFSEPRRWDVVVFKNPQRDNETNHTPGPDTNYIKRLVGLPNEKLAIFEGNIYTKATDGLSEAGPDPFEGGTAGGDASGSPSGDASGDASGGPSGGWSIARKPQRPEAQRAVWQPIYHSSYIPVDPSFPWVCPWRPTGDQAAAWQVQNRRRYRFNSAKSGELAFDFDAGRAGLAYDDPRLMYPYNQFAYQTPQQQRNPDEFIEDIRLAVEVEPDKPGLTVTLSTTARLDSPTGVTQTLWAGVGSDGKAHLRATRPDGQTRELVKPYDWGPLPAGQSTRLELWYADQQASLWINGKRVLSHNINLPMRLITSRSRAPRRPNPRIHLAGSPATLNRVDLDRDLFYASRNPPGVGGLGHGCLARLGDRVVGKPITIGPDEFFCMGDNSPRSSDGRFWTTVYPWVRQRYFEGRDRTGLVPRDLMIGRAFFVYLPAPFPWSRGHRGILPNFGDMRFIH